LPEPSSCIKELLRPQPRVRIWLVRVWVRIQSQSFLLTYPELIKAYDVFSSVFICDMKAWIAQLNGCLLNCFDWELITLCNVHWCLLVEWVT